MVEVNESQILSNRPSAIIAEVAALNHMSRKDLQDKWQELYGTEAPNNNAPFLISRLAYRLQELKYGGISKPTMRRLELALDDTKRRKDRVTRPLIGTRLIREYQGVEHRVTVCQNGFEYRKVIYRSLTQIAEVVTGSHISGPRFFGLRD